MSEFFAMGGYAVYVWGSYGVAALVLVALLLLSLRGLRENETILAALETSAPARGGRKRRAGQSGDGAEMMPAYLAMAGSDAGGRKPGSSADPAKGDAGGDTGGDGGGGGGE